MGADETIYVCFVFCYHFVDVQMIVRSGLEYIMVGSDVKSNSFHNKKTD